MASRSVLSATRSRALSLGAVRRQHYYFSLRDHLQHGAQVLLIAVAFTSILLPLVFASLFAHAAGLGSAVWSTAFSLVTLQAIGIAWVLLQKQAITGARYDICLRSLPLGFPRWTLINTRILIEADAILAFLWLAGLTLIFIQADRPHPAAAFWLRIAVITGSIVAVQYSWLWSRSRNLLLASVTAFDAALVLALGRTAATDRTVTAAALLLFAGAAASALLVALNSSTRMATFIQRAWPAKLRYHSRRRQAQSSLHRSFLLVTLAGFYRAALLRSVCGDFVLRTLAALAACTLAILAVTSSIHNPIAPLLWLAGVIISANSLASLGEALKTMHAGPQKYFGALPLGPKSVRLADTATLCILTLIVTGTFAIAGSILVPSRATGLIAGVAAALLVSAGQLEIGTHGARHRVTLTLLLDIAVLAAFGWIYL